MMNKKIKNKPNKNRKKLIIKKLVSLEKDKWKGNVKIQGHEVGEEHEKDKVVCDDVSTEVHSK